LRSGLHNIRRRKSGKTLDKARFSGNKSLQEGNGLMKKPSMTPRPRISRWRKFPSAARPLLAMS
jgi:hypothetical protein